MYHELGCGSVMEIEEKAGRSILGGYVIVGTIKLTTTKSPPSIPSDTRSIRVLEIHGATNGIEGGTGCN